MKTKLPLITVFVLALTPAVARAGNQTVNNLGDTGLAGQLRAKVTACQSGTSPGGTITFASALSGTITLDPTKGPLPTITTNVTIDGAGAVEVNGNDQIRIFNVATGATLTLKNITISHASAASGDGGAVASTGTVNAQDTKFFYNQTSAGSSGSAILCWGPLTITNCEFGFNSGGGGAVKPRSSGAITTISGSNFHDNTSTSSAGGGYGGAMQVFDGPSVTITNSTFSKNKAATAGGAIYVTNNATLNVTDCTFSDNQTLDADPANGGGGVYNNGSLTLMNVTLNGNQALGGFGGGIRHAGATATLTNVTLSGNSALDAGAIYTIGALQLTNVTMAGNSSGYAGGIGGIWQDTNSNSVTFHDTVIAKGASGGNCHLQNYGKSESNLSDDNTCAFTFSSGDIQRDGVTDLLLGPLANNGGPTKTHLPQLGSRAIDNGLANGAPSDQRGVKRPQGVQFDVGAVEVVQPLVEDSNPYVQYDSWRGFKNKSANGGSYRMSNVTLESVTYKFTGTSLKWITRKGPDMGKAFVTLDNGTSTIYDLYSSTTQWNQQIVFSGLPNTTHTIIIQVGGLKNASATGFNVALDGFLVGSSTKVVQESAVAIQYNGWTGKKQTAASGGSYRISSNQGSPSVLFRFKGTTIDFITAQGPSYGYVNVLIDGNLVSSNLDLYSPTQVWKYGLYYSGLANANHTIEVRPANFKNANSTGIGVVVDAFTGLFTALP